MLLNHIDPTIGSPDTSGSMTSSMPHLDNTDEGLSRDALPKKRTYSSHLGDDGQALLPDSKSRRTTPSPRGYNFNGPSNGFHGPTDSPPIIDLTGDDDDDQQLDQDRAQHRQREDLSFSQQEQALEDAYFAEQFPNGVENHGAMSIPSRVPSQSGSHESNPMTASPSETSPPELPIFSPHFQDESYPGSDMMGLPTRIKSSMPREWHIEDDLFGEDPIGPSNDELFTNTTGILDPISPGLLTSTVPPGSLYSGHLNSYLAPQTSNSLDAIAKQTNGFDFGKGLDNRIHAAIQNLRTRTSHSDRGDSGKHIKDLLANLSTENGTIPGSDRDPTPDGLQGTLYPHQQIALKWMRGMENDKNKRGGFLADDMGLGKTISTLSLILSNPPPSSGSGRANKVCNYADSRD
jgi:hypothetical protein